MNKNFIAEYKNILPDLTCDNLTELFEKRTDLHSPGIISLDGEAKEVPEWKKSVEISLNPTFLDENIQPEFAPVMQSLLLCLQEGLKKYRQEYTFQNEDENYAGIDAILNWGVDYACNFQRFLPGEGYKVSHCEVPGKHISQRVLVWMFYLNDVEDKGGTEFQFQKYTCKAEKGKLVIWPPYWTHFHRGIVSPTESKYIITGWCSFL